MERLTFDGLFCDLAVCQEVPCKYPETGCSQRQVWERLKQLEDILGDTYDLSRLKELVEDDREGRLLPITVGQTVYILSPEGIDEEKIIAIISDGKTIMVEISHFLGVYEYSEDNFGNWVFLTREAAEKALEVLNGKTE